MSKQRKAAGKTATNNGGAKGAANTRKGKGILRTTTRKGERVLVAPDGRVFHGTAQEVRDAALTPRSRRSLADDIGFARRTADRFCFTPEQKREYIREKRREALRRESQFALLGEPVEIPADVYILLEAGSRLVRGDGEDFDKFLAEVFQSQLDALLDVAQDETGKREIPLTRHERAALERLRGTSRP